MGNSFESIAPAIERVKSVLTEIYGEDIGKRAMLGRRSEVLDKKGWMIFLQSTRLEIAFVPDDSEMVIIIYKGNLPPYREY